MASLLATIVRRQFPGAYDEVPDMVLENAWTEKHPEDRHLADIPHPPTEPLWKPGPIPAPQMTWGQRMMARLPTPEQAKTGARQAATTLFDPEALGAVAGGMAAAGKPWPVAALAAGTGAGGVAAARELYQAVQERRAPRPGPIGTALLGGALGESAARLLPLRPAMDPLGREVAQTFGPDVATHQLTESTPYNIAGNIARYGPGGQDIMAALERRQSEKMLANLEATRRGIVPALSQTAAGEVTPTAAGAEIKGSLLQSLRDVRGASGYPEFLKVHGAARAIDHETGKAVGLSVQTLHDQRSKLLLAARRADAADQAQLVEHLTSQAANKMRQIQQILPSAAGREYADLSSEYAREIYRVDNPLIRRLRKDKGESIIQKVLTDTLPTYKDRYTGLGLENEELLSRIRDATTPRAWRQFQADTLHEFTQRSLDAGAQMPGREGVLDLKLYEKALNSLSPESQQILFGSGMREIHQVNRLLGRLQGTRSGGETGRLFIAIRAPSEFMRLVGGTAALGAGVGGLHGGRAGAQTGAEVGAGAGLLSAGAFLISPRAFANILTSPVARRLLVRAQESGPAREALRRWIIQSGVEAGRESLGGDQAGTPRASLPPPPPQP